MSTVLWTTTAVLLLLINIALHEAGHALVLVKLGGRIREAGLGLPFPPRLVLPPRGRRQFRLSLSPWVIAAYVEPDPDSETMVQQLSYRDQAWFAGVGVIVNAVIATAVAALVFALQGRWVAMSVTLAIGAAIWVVRKLICMAIPLLGVGAVVLVALSVLHAARTEQASGPLGVASALTVGSASEMLTITFLLSASLAILNCLPLYPFDGGRVVDAALRIWAPPAAASWFRGVTLCAALVFLTYVVISDVFFTVT